MTIGDVAISAAVNTTADTALNVVKELVVIDVGVSGVEAMLADLALVADPTRQVVVLGEAGSDASTALSQLSSILAEYRDLDAVHLVSRGTAGELLLAGERIDTVDLLSHTALIGQWRDAFAPGAEFLIYGCDVAAGTQGEAFVETLSLLSGADVAASTDLTGGDRAGGDWTLEYQRGDTQHPIAFSDNLPQNYTETFAGLTTTSLNVSPRSALISDAHSVTASPIIFVDTSVSDYQLLLDELMASNARQEPYDVVLIESGADGLALIGNTLQRHQNLGAVHLVSHGNDGELILGDSVLNYQSLPEALAALSQWANALSDQADIFIYGCDIARSASGQVFVEQLAAITQADVAASTDTTGATSVGGDWVLEYNVSDVTHDAALRLDEESAWQHVLETGDADQNALEGTEGDDTHDGDATNNDVLGGAVDVLAGLGVFSSETDQR